MTLHTTATWPARSDRRAALVWLAIFWIFVGFGFGFGFDLHHYFHETPAVPTIVHVHAIATTGWLLIGTALVLLVETDNVQLHRRLGWFAAYFAGAVLLLAPISEMSWQALNLTTADAPPPQFLAVAFCAPLCMGVLLVWGIRLRRNTAAHRRVLMLATICISDAGFSRLILLFVRFPSSFWGSYLVFEGGNLLLIALMLAWDAYRDRLMRQFVVASAFVVAVTLTGTWLFFNPTCSTVTRHWLEAWGRRGW